MGTYDILGTNGGSLIMHYTTVTGAVWFPVQVGDTLALQWSRANNGDLTISGPFGQEQWNLRQPSVIDGTWQFASNGSVMVMEFVAGMHSMLGMQAGVPSSAGVSFGEFFVKSSERLFIYYSFAPAVDEAQLLNGTFSVSSTLNLVLWDPVSKRNHKLIGGKLQVANPFWEGVWRGSTQWPDGSFCVTTMDFRGNVFRTFDAECTPTTTESFGTWLGIFKGTCTSMAMTFMFEDLNGQGNQGLLGETVDFKVTSSELGNSVQVVLTTPGSTAIQRLVKIDL